MILKKMKKIEMHQKICLIMIKNMKKNNKKEYSLNNYFYMFNYTTIY